MRSNNLMNAIVKTAALAGVMLVSAAANAANVDVYLQAQSFTKQLTLPDSTVVNVDMWGFATCTDDTFATCDDAASTNAPGPRIDVPFGDSLTIHLNNTLSTPVSIHVPGQMEASAGAPEIVGGRVQSFGAETPPGMSHNYVWTTLRPGTYLYQSGTHPSIQVPMGLYGALVVAGPTAPTAEPCPSGMPAYDDVDSCYDSDVVMLFSEIDPVQNQQVTDAADVASYPSTVDYSPSFLLINGELSIDLQGIGDDDPLTALEGGRTLLRLLNAGSRTHTPAVVGLDMQMVAEDGNVYPGLPQIEAQALLPAGKTRDAIVNLPAGDVTFALYDRTPDFTNADLPGGGLIATIKANEGSSPVTPTAKAVDDTYAPDEDCGTTPSCTSPWLSTSRLDQPSVLGNDDGLSDATVVSTTAHGTLDLMLDGTFEYSPDENFSGVDGFTYTATDGTNNYSASVTLNVSFVNDAPFAMDDGPYANIVGADITVDAAHGVLGNDGDPDGDEITAVLDAAPASGSLNLMPDGSFTYTGGPGPTSFTYHVNDGTEDSAIVTATLNVNPVSGITLTVQEPGGTPVDEYRWTVEEDAMWQPDPAMPDAESLATNFHRSYMPVVAQGIGADEFAQLALDSTKHYFVSVLPLDAVAEDETGYRVGHTIGGARIMPGDAEVTVTVNKEPLPYAQISAFVFEDRGPTNAAVDGNEPGLGGFQIIVEDAGGRYGISAGVMSQDADGNPLKNSLDCFGGDEPPLGVILTCPDTPANQAAGVVGEVLIKNLFPGKYGISAVPAGNAVQDWVQTSTIEGTKIIDAWVKAGEPAYFTEFGPVGWHVAIGFVSPARVAAANPGGANTVTGKVTNLHMYRPPNQNLFDSGSYAAMAHTRAWVGLNSEGGIGTNIAAVRADDEGNFTISNVPDGEFQLVVWDDYLDQVIAYKAVSLPTGGAVGNVPVFQWFARLENNVFLDDGAGGGTAGNGIRDGGEVGMPEQAVNLRWRDGSVYQSFPTDLTGFVPFDQMFPFFHWLVAEVDYTRFKPTGLVVTVDGGGDTTVGPYPGVLGPQIQTEDCADPNCWSRKELGPVLTQGIQGFLGQTSVLDWGKMPYAPGENGGISGIVYYGVTRAEGDPQLAAAEPWEPGIPRVTVRLYREIATSDGGTTLAYVTETETDSWDDNLPTGCPGADPSDPVTPLDKCYDGLRNFNQARPGVFDGGYAFNNIPAGTYVVEVVPPPGYELLKEEDVNVGFGDGYASVFVTMPGGAVVPAVPDPAIVESAMFDAGLAQPPCVGELREVPQTLSLFPAANAEAPFRGALRPLCDRKRVILSDQGQAAADFTLFTSAPIAGHFVGMVLDDVAQEFNPLSIQFGEKWAPPFVPISVRDYTGREISRTYSDQWGRMNGLVPSTFTANMPSPSGFSPAMLMTCMNDPGPIPGPGGELITDPQYNPQYSNFCYTFQYMPGTTTYLDTPVLPVASFASGYNPADCALDDGTPVIAEVETSSGMGPWLTSSGARDTKTITISSLGTMVDVPNPGYEGPLAMGDAAMKTIQRDFGFGTSQGNGSVTLGGIPLVILDWNEDTIVARPERAGVGSPQPGTGQLVVTRDNGNSTENGITLTYSNTAPTRVMGGSQAGEHKLQAAIDAAAPGALIIVEPGDYNESVIMWKPVRLQGSGAGSTFINAVKRPTESLQQWRDKMDNLFGIGGGTKVVDALPNQPDGAAGFDTSEGAAITVLGRNTNSSGQGAFSSFQSRIDGFSITGADVGGGIMVNSYAHELQISNNHVFGNSGSWNGGIRIGQPFLELPWDGQAFAFNEDINVHHNSITQNGGLGGAGGGLSIATGTDNYIVTDNYVCGNFTTGDGGGIGHLGFSDGGTIAHNRIVLNQSFNQGVTVSGGGVFIGGEPDAAALTQGSGDVLVDANLIQGNHAGAGHGGGIRTQFVNGLDIDNPSVTNWNTITITNNMVVDNVAGWSGGGMALQDTLRSIIVNNTIAHNDSTATVGALVSNDTSVPQPAGLSTMAHSDLLEGSIPNNRAEYRGFSKPTQLVNNIAWQNRAFYYDVNMGAAILQPDLVQASVGDCPAGAEYWDMGVIGGPGVGTLSPTYSVLSDEYGTVPDASTSTADPELADAYCNGGRPLLSGPGSMLALPALDEGGNAWIDVRFGPLDVRGDYHVSDTGSAYNAGANSIGSPSVAPDFDFDGDSRPQAGTYDIGADEVAP